MLWHAQAKEREKVRSTFSLLGVSLKPSQKDYHGAKINGVSSLYAGREKLEKRRRLATGKRKFPEGNLGRLWPW